MTFKQLKLDGNNQSAISKLLTKLDSKTPRQTHKEIVPQKKSQLKPFDVAMMIERAEITNTEELLKTAQLTENLGFYQKVKKDPQSFLRDFKTEDDESTNDGYGVDHPYIPRRIKKFLAKNIIDSRRRARVKPLILLGKRERGKTDFLMNFLRLCTPTKGTIDFSLFSSKPKAKYIVLDDLDVKKEDLKMYKALFSGQPGSFHSKYSRIIHLSGLPCIFITNEMKDFDFFYEHEDFKDDCEFHIMLEDEYWCPDTIKEEILKDRARVRCNFTINEKNEKVLQRKTKRDSSAKKERK